jgi:hypothetical protein
MRIQKRGKGGIQIEKGEEGIKIQKRMKEAYR